MAAVEKTFFLYDQGQIVLQFDKTGTGDATTGDLTHRYLWSDAVDQLLADESATGDILWPLTDHLNTIRDLAEYNAATDTTTIVNHRTYDAFGKLTSETNAAVDSLFGYTGRPLDEATGLQNNLHRWYDAQVGRWISEDPIGFEAGDANLARYVKNQTIQLIDYDGREPKVAAQITAALARGDIQFAMELLGGLGARAGVATYSAIISNIYQRYPAASLQCDRAAQMVQRVFTVVERESQIIRIVGSRGERFFFIGKDAFSKSGEHFAVLSKGRVYDALTGPSGMALKDYVHFWVTNVGANPVITDQAGKVIK